MEKPNEEEKTFVPPVVYEIGDIIECQVMTCFCAYGKGTKAEIVGHGRKGIYFARIFAQMFAPYEQSLGQLVEIDTRGYPFWDKVEGKVVR